MEYSSEDESKWAADHPHRALLKCQNKQGVGYLCNASARIDLLMTLLCNIKVDLDRLGHFRMISLSSPATLQHLALPHHS
jgi:hypothetical protein